MIDANGVSRTPRPAEHFDVSSTANRSPKVHRRLMAMLRPAASAVAALLILSACTSGNSAGGRPSAAELNKYFFTPPPGKGQYVFGQDRIQCAYAVKPWTIDGYRDCMLARGNLVFEWSATKGQAEVQHDKLECSRSISNTLSEQREREFESCLQARGTLVAASSQAASASRSQMQSYLAPQTLPPSGMCSNFARGDRRLFNQCMENSRSYSERYCLEATNGQANLYISCMAQRGFAVSGLPEEYTASTPAASSTIRPRDTPQSGGLTASQQSVLDQLREDLMDAAVHCGFEYAAISVVLKQKAHPFRCLRDKIGEDILFRKHPSLSSIRSAICENPRVLTRIPSITEAVTDDVAALLRCGGSRS